MLVALPLSGKVFPSRNPRLESLRFFPIAHPFGNVHVSERKRRLPGTGTKDKTAVMEILERDGKVRTTVVPSRRKRVLQEEVRKHVTAGAALYTDALLSYKGLAGDYAHKVVDHAVQYVDGRVHTNGLENYWSLLKRGILGTDVSVDPFHAVSLP